MIRSGSAVQMNGFGSWLVWVRKRLMAACRSTSERNTPRLSQHLLSLAKKPSTALSQEADVGVCLDPVVEAGPPTDPVRSAEQRGESGQGGPGIRENPAHHGNRI